MKAHVRCKWATVEVEGENPKNLFSAISRAYEVFSEPCCGLCGKDDIRPVVRVVTSGKKTFEYFEYQCNSCFAKLSLGQSNEGGGLFPKRKLDKEGKPDLQNGEYGPHRGWTKYRGPAHEE
jgi:hypothetical protein